jgi:peptidoglycan/LPS O-acetylase OafA/YrhL
MLRSILAIIASYVVMFVLFLAVFTGLYLVLGTERVFQPDSYEISNLWLALTLIFGFLGTIVAGFLCATLSRKWRTCQIFALIVFALASVQCLMALRRQNPDAPNVRAGEVSYFEAIEHAVTPFWLHVVNPIVNGAGALLGARMKRREPA